MPDTISSQYMNLPVPIVSVDPGPQWATDVNSCLTLIDSHNHAPGYGQLITPSGLSINADITFVDNNATNLRSSRYFVQPSLLSAGADIGCTYVSGVDLYYNDINGNQVRITASGAVAGTPGSIGNLVSPANVTYVSGTQTYVFQSTTATAGNIDAGSITLREVVASANGVILSSPTSLAASYSLIFPGALPASTKILTVDVSGNIGDAYDVDNSSITVISNVIQVKAGGITPTMMGSVIYAASSSCGSFSTNSTIPISVTNLSVTVTSTGRPIVCGFMSDGTSASNGSFWSSVTSVGEIIITRDGAMVGDYFLNGASVPLPGPFTDNVAAGTHTYAVLARNSNGNSMSINRSVLFAYQI